MNIQAEKLGLIEWIAKLNDSSVLEKLKQIYEENTQNNVWDDVTLHEKESIERGLKNIEEGKVHPHHLAKEVYEKYL